ncbi:MAG TPA: hypothetical protein ENI23_06725 [bacterium]|nr:hypothetical protein [bacterium]
MVKFTDYKFCDKQHGIYVCTDQDARTIKWNPYKDENHFRQVLEKVMKYDKENDTHLLTDLMKGTATERTLKAGDEGDHLRYFGYIAFDYIESDLPTRAKALIKVLTSGT